MGAQYESDYWLPDPLRLNTVDQSSQVKSALGELSVARSGFGLPDQQLQWSKNWATQNTATEPVTSISSFMAAVAEINPPFKPRTLHRPWSISAGYGAHSAVEVHRYVRGRDWDVFKDSSSLKLLTYEPDPKRTGDYYAVKRLTLLDPEAKGMETQSQRNPYA